MTLAVVPPVLAQTTAPASVEVDAGASVYPVCGGRSPSGADVAVAKKTFELANRYLSEADYDRAIQYFLDAYRSDCTAHKLLGYLARAHELRGDRIEAVRALEAYLERAPRADDRAVVERRVANLRAQLPRAGGGPDGGAVEFDAGVDAGGFRPDAAQSFVERPPAPPLFASPWPWVLAGTGAALALGGGIASAVGGAKIADAERTCGGRQCVADVDVASGNAGRSTQVAGNATMVVGVALVVGGAAWWLLERRSAPARVGVAPTVGAGFAGAEVGGRF